MARMPGAVWHAVRNYTEDGQDAVRGVVVHIMAGTLEGSQAWFNNPTAQASSHFGTGKAGALRQWVDTDDRAWAQAAGNRTWLSVENEGVGGDALTDAQLDDNAAVLAWAHETYDVPLRLASGPDDRGLGYHAMGGSAWGGHTSCPGPRIVQQLPEIVARAKRLVAGPTETEEDDMALNAADVTRILTTDGIVPAPSNAPDAKTNKFWTVASHLATTTAAVRSIQDSQADQSKQIAALTKAVAALTAKLEG
ncbi:peptidoglycan recognition protein family protein [Streptomyces sp. OR43]|uniref:peptidoglycan recognition protein family protein n=1 Tax=Streptomyces sp. or43 TaxID=2478957 RepID=UPI0011CD7BB6|nr:peptidoglycan recognition family protein [Streptomyces sp. or43]TXS35707.1 N-acetylmuramoyl-L-alanine amidase [Streptomyces sp. or43]